MTVETWKRKMLIADAVTVHVDDGGDTLHILLLAKDGTVFAQGAFTAESAGAFAHAVRRGANLARMNRIDLQ